MGICYHRAGGTVLTGYTDSDWAASKDDRKSVSGYCFNIGSGTISWAARRQTCVATSTAEAELHALSEATKECMHLTGILHDLGFDRGRARIYSDSQSCLALVKKESNNSNKAKHFATRLEFVKESVKDIELDYVASADNMADLLTKGLGRSETERHRDQLSAKRGFQDCLKKESERELTGDVKNETNEECEE